VEGQLRVLIVEKNFHVLFWMMILSNVGDIMTRVSWVKRTKRIMEMIQMKWGMIFLLLTWEVNQL